MSLTALQEQYVDFIHRYVFLNDNFPTCEEISKHFGVWPNAAKEKLDLLEKKGFIERVINRQCYRRTDTFKKYIAYKVEHAA